MNVNIQVYPTTLALGADAVYSSTTGFLYLTGFQPILAKGIRPDSKIIAPVTETLQVTTLTPTASQNSTQFGISINFFNKASQSYQTKDLTFTSDASMTVTEVCDGFRNQINALSSIMPIAATGTTTLILTAVTGLAQYAQFTVSNISSFPGVWTSITTGTPAVIAVGRGNDLKAGENANKATRDLLVDTSYYYQAIINYKNSGPTGSSQEAGTLIDRSVVYALSTDTNVGTLMGTYGTLTNALAGHFPSTAVVMTTSSTMAYTQATGVLTMTGGAGTWSSQLIKVGDILSIDSAPTAFLPVLLETTNLLGVSVIGLNGAADIAAGAYHIIHLT